MPFLQAQQVAALAQGIPGGSATTIGTAMQPQQQTSPLQLLMGGLALAGMFASDRRLKRDIKFLEWRNGLPLHTFRYRWGGPTYVGVIAQEIERFRPDCVLSICGFKIVNYRKLGLGLVLLADYAPYIV